jgi:hypothetical protein
VISLTGAVLIAWAIGVLIVLYAVLKPLYTPGSISSVLSGLRPNFRYAETYRANMAERKKNS